MKILAVDDDINALAILELALREAGYDNYDLVLSSAEALELIENADIQYDCLLLDIVMPGMNGVDLCRLVRKMPLYAHVPIIMITASKQKDTLTCAIASGATDYVNKPFEGLELVTRLRAAESLMKATRRNGHRDPRGSMPDHVVGLQLSDGFTLNANHCFFSQTELVCALGETDRYQCSIHLFAAALMDVERLFDTVSNLKFRNLINELATSIAFITEGWRPLISYAGDGVFVIALLDVGFLSAKDIHKVLKAGIEAQSLTCPPRNPSP